MSGVVFSDNDIILKLAEYDLLEDTCSCLGVDPSEVIVLNTAKHYFRHLLDKFHKKPDPRRSESGILRAITFAENAQSITEYPDLSWAEGEDDIDIGEALLAVSAAGITGAKIMLTGDKKFLTAFANCASAKPLYTGLSGCIVCLEELFKALIVHKGFPEVCAVVQKAPLCDGSIGLVFGSRFDLSESQVTQGLDSTVADLEKSVGSGWLMRL